MSLLSAEKATYLYYNPSAIVAKSNLHLPGVARFRDFFKMLSANVCFVDRTGVLKTPIRTEVWGPLPKLRPSNKSYEDCCNERAVELLRHAEALDLPLYVFYSGGIDSTLVLVSFLKHATPAQRERLVVLLSNESIGENVRFYREHILGKLKIEMAVTFPFLLNKRGIFVCGELNDQLLGSDVTGALSARFGNDAIHAQYNRDLFRQLWSPSVEDPASVDWYLDRFEALRDRAPLPIGSNVEFLWWINFALKWQSVVFRIVSYMSDFNVPAFDRTFFDRHFFAFFATDDFQLWSMNNLDKKIKSSWSSYKFEAKDVIYAFNRDADYRDNKVKRYSLYWIILHQTQKNFIRNDYTMLMNQAPEDWYQADHSFTDS